jgi:predicted aspartyl protease
LGVSLALTLAMTLAIPGGAQSEREEVPFELHNEYLIVVKGSVGKLKNLSSAVSTSSCLSNMNETQAQQSDTTLPVPIPFQLRNGFLIIVEGGIGPLAQLKFVLDTGATYTMVDRKIADKLSLPRQSGNVINFDRYEKVEWTDIAELHLGPLKVQNFRVMVGDLKRFSELADGVDAIIGLDLLSMSRRFRIDYVAGAVLLQAGSRAAHSDLRQEEPKPFVVPILVQGRPIRLAVDTGMEGIQLYEDRVRKQVPGLRLLDEINGVRFGRLQMKRARLPGVYLGSEEKVLEVYLMRGPEKDIFPDIDGYLGTASLNARQIEFDFEGNKLRWQ